MVCCMLFARDTGGEYKRFAGNEVRIVPKKEPKMVQFGKQAPIRPATGRSLARPEPHPRRTRFSVSKQDITREARTR